MENEPLRATRERIYRKYIKPQGLFPSVNGRVLVEEPNAAKRRANFLMFVDYYFSEKASQANGSSVPVNGPSRLTLSSDGYKAFVKFADTSYGSSVIKEMVDKNNRKKYQEFVITESTSGVTRASYSGMVVSWSSPFKSIFIANGQVLDPLAVLYQEFSHTMVFKSESQKKSERDLKAEREAVIKFENPVRMLNKHEPRYSYVTHDGSRTINILTGETKPGILAVNKSNPAELVDRTHKDALK